MKLIDLQIHTTTSDGAYSASEVVDLALRKGMQTIAITDHDSIGAIKEAVEYSKDKEINFIPGIEISCREKGIESTIDILGLFIDYESKELNGFLERFKQERRVAFVKEAIDIIKQANGISVLAHPGRYIREESKVLKIFLEARGDGIEVDYPYGKILRIKEEKSDEINMKFKKLARKNNLLESGGSDFHDLERGSEIGDGGVEKEDFNLMIKYLSSGVK